jgi:hypothetical protein
MLPTIITDYFWQLWEFSHSRVGRRPPRLKPARAFKDRLHHLSRAIVASNIRTA